MKRRLRKVISALLTMMIIVGVFSISPFIVSAVSAIYGNGTNGIYIDILSAPYTTYQNKPYGNNAYTTVGCAWFASARAYQITGVDSPIFSGSSWYNEQYANYGYSRGNTIRAKALACYSNHIAVVEKVENDTVTISEGGIADYCYADNGYCAIRTMSIAEVQSARGGNFLGYVYLGGASDYVDLGTDFYAYISHLASWNHLTVEDNGNVDICWETYRANQYWKFYRQFDGSYKIVSAYNGKCLDVQGGSKEDGANVQTYADNGTDAQRWYIYKQGNAYQLKPKCSDCVIEMNAWSFYQGVNLVAGTKDNSDAEIFAINIRDFNSIGTTNLNISNSANGIVNFSWIPALCATNYNLKIWNGSSVQPGEAPINLWNVQNNNISVNLGSGTFTVYLESYNAIGDYVQGQSQTFNFEVSDYTPAHTVVYKSHMYSIYNTPTSWEKAKLICEQNGGHLATITSAEEQDVINELLNYGNLKYYSIGANNLTSSGDWEWVTNEPFDYSNWADGEPNNVLNIENYLSIFNVDAYKGKWNDTSNVAISGVSNGFICEVENISQMLFGDVDNNGAVTVDDVTIIQKYLADISEFSDTQKSVADVNGDGDVMIDDVTAIQKYIAGIITSLG